MKDSNLEPVYDLFRYFLIGGGVEAQKRMKDLRFLVRRQFMSISSLYDDTENGGDDIRLFLSPQKTG